jgi:Acyl-protein synthetase, LuxE
MIDPAGQRAKHRRTDRGRAFHLLKFGVAIRHYPWLSRQTSQAQSDPDQNRMSIDATFADISHRLLDLIGRHPGDHFGGEGAFTELALDLFALQFRHIPVYQRLCQARGATPGRISDWRAIPAIPTRAFKEFELTSLPQDQCRRVFVSSGTTSERRSRHFHNEHSLRIYEASLAPWFAAHLLAEAPKDMRLVILTPSPEEAPESSLVHMFDTVRRRFAFASSAFLGRADEDGAWSLNLAETTALLRHGIAEGKPVLLLGTAFSFVHLIDYLGDTGATLKLPEGSMAMETGGYKGRSRALERGELHALISERLGIVPAHLVSEYGMSELSSQAYDHVAGDATAPTPKSTWSHNRVFRFPPWARVQMLSPETGLEVKEGEAGLVKVLDLANVYSVLAVQTEDLAIRRGGGFELLGRVVEAEPRGCSLMAR